MADTITPPRTFHTRALVVNAQSQGLMFDTAEQQDAFYKALGRMVAYALVTHDADTVGLASLSIDSHHEITGVYYPREVRVPFEAPMEVRQTSKFEIVEEQITNLQRVVRAVQGSGRGFVMGGVPRNEATEYTFHS